MDEDNEGAALIVEVDEPEPISGWKLLGKSSRFLNESEYLGASFSVSGLMRSHSLEVAKERSDGDVGPRGRCPQLAAVLTRSVLYIRTFRLTLTTRVVRAPRRGCGRSRGLITGSMAGYPLIQALRRAGTPSVAALEPSALGESCQRIKERIRCSVAAAARR